MTKPKKERGVIMQTVNIKTVVQITVEFADEEFTLLLARTSAENSPRYIHDAMMRNLKRKARKAKVNVDEEAFLQKAKEDE